MAARRAIAVKSPDESTGPRLSKIISGQRATDEDLGDGIFKLEYKVDEINEWEGPIPREYIERSSARADTLSPGDQVLVVVKEDEQLSGFHRLKSRYEPSLSEWWRLETVYAHRGDGTYTMVSSHATDHYHADAIIPRTSLTARPGRKLLELPPRHDHVTHVEFDDEERAAYERVAAQAKREAVGLFAQGDAVARSQTLRFLSLLTPLRSACSGGPIPTTIQTRHRKGADADDSDDDADAARQADVYAGASLMRSKLVTLLKALAEIRAADPSSKSLVFSQFASTLKWLQSELPRHGFSYRCITGDMSKNARAQALRDFREDPPTTIFLLSIKAGACGINLTQANHVFMMEPCLNPALEAQAVGRVHRMGQTRDCHITRLIIACPVSCTDVTPACPPPPPPRDNPPSPPPPPPVPVGNYPPMCLVSNGAKPECVPADAGGYGFCPDAIGMAAIGIFGAMLPSCCPPSPLEPAGRSTESTLPSSPPGSLWTSTSWIRSSAHGTLRSPRV